MKRILILIALLIASCGGQPPEGIANRQGALQPLGRISSCYGPPIPGYADLWSASNYTGSACERILPDPIDPDHTGWSVGFVYEPTHSPFFAPYTAQSIHLATTGLPLQVFVCNGPPNFAPGSGYIGCNGYDWRSTVTPNSTPSFPWSGYGVIIGYTAPRNCKDSADYLELTRYHTGTLPYPNGGVSYPPPVSYTPVLTFQGGQSYYGSAPCMICKDNAGAAVLLGNNSCTEVVQPPPAIQPIPAPPVSGTNDGIAPTQVVCVPTATAATWGCL